MQFIFQACSTLPCDEWPSGRFGHSWTPMSLNNSNSTPEEVRRYCRHHEVFSFPSEMAHKCSIHPSTLSAAPQLCIDFLGLRSLWGDGQWWNVADRHVALFRGKSFVEPCNVCKLITCAPRKYLSCGSRCWAPPDHRRRKFMD